MTTYLDQLRQLASLHGIRHNYRDVAGQLQEASADSLFRMLQVYGVPLDRPEDVAGVLRASRQAHWQRMLEPVVVAWEGRASIPLRFAATTLSGGVRMQWKLDSGEVRQHHARLADLPTQRQLRVDGIKYVVKQLQLPGRLPWGYHHLHLETAGQTAEAMVIAAPRQAYRGEPGDPTHLWGLFLPLYSLRRRSSWGAGDFSDLAAMMQWTAEQGGNMVATLPLAASVNLMDDPSPYSPGTRLFWNEFYVDVTRIPEFAHSPKAQQLLESREVRKKLEALRAEPLVDYHEQMGIKHQVLEALAETFFATDSSRRAALQEYCSDNPRAEAYAQFRAAADRHGLDWTRWPKRLASGAIEPGDYDEAAFRYHLYAQWQTEEQLRAATDHARESNLLWYLDFPLGVSRSGFDVWSQREIFALEASGGAPPDAFFTKGQNWGFPPLHPERLRQQQYRYMIDSLRGQLRYAKVLRIDHVMSLYRLFWVPEGMSAKEGVYVHYPLDELFAVVTLESHRYKARIVGENLGTVPPEVDAAMARHAVRDMYVVQYELKPDPEQPMGKVRSSSVASLNTHDMPTFKAFYEALDVEDRLDLDLLTADQAVEIRKERDGQCRRMAEFLRRRGLLNASNDDTQAVMEACQVYLGLSPAAVVLLNLEDLWGETQPQNTPGTFKERPNWRHKARYSLEEFRKLPNVLKIIRRVAEARTKAADGE
jgi:4-alpha-glucanotransferase